MDPLARVEPAAPVRGEFRPDLIGPGSGTNNHSRGLQLDRLPSRRRQIPHLKTDDLFALPDRRDRLRVVGNRRPFSSGITQGLYRQDVVPHAGIEIPESPFKPLGLEKRNLF